MFLWPTEKGSMKSTIVCNFPLGTVDNYRKLFNKYFMSNHEIMEKTVIKNKKYKW